MWQGEGAMGGSHVPWRLDGTWLCLSMQMRRRKAVRGGNGGVEAEKDIDR